ncbi:hypothetical protein AAW02_06945 [Aeromonas dhakensis]|uniref:DUF7079 family protein n=1 Tax=Aeromonas dhakensis TaxID=196024 RepID=UPI000C0BF96F|nr:hypothetical protein [Aeromonas dhakensis]PHS84998.1 hypothetical protein AAW03_15080 [Aeromonas dhakensis]PHS89345.1 hypothetical protein AAW02_06945 [Aeromonas dhakensis]
MEQPLSDIYLCEVLSDLFVYNEVDYEYIAKVARAFPVTHVEKVLFEWVAPVCYINTLAPVPPIWTGFERDSLWAEIQRLQAREAKAGFAKKLSIMLRQFYLRQQFSEEWRRLSALLSEQG